MKYQIRKVDARWHYYDVEAGSIEEAVEKWHDGKYKELPFEPDDEQVLYFWGYLYDEKNDEYIKCEKISSFYDFEEKIEPKIPNIPF